VFGVTESLMATFRPVTNGDAFEGPYFNLEYDFTLAPT
jgi:hypothetical protein